MVDPRIFSFHMNSSVSMHMYKQDLLSLLEQFFLSKEWQVYDLIIDSLSS